MPATKKSKLETSHEYEHEHGHGRSPDERPFIPEPEVITTTVGSYLAQRLVEAGTSTFFNVPGDYILGLLDSLLMNKGLKMVGCCNELNGGYAG